MGGIDATLQNSSYFSYAMFEEGGEDDGTLHRYHKKSDSYDSEKENATKQEDSSTTNRAVRVPEQNRWLCCSGGVLDSRLLNYCVKCFFSLISLLFCMYKLCVHNSQDTDTTVWVSLISAIIGNFLPNNHEDKN